MILIPYSDSLTCVVVACSACTEVICVDVVKQCIAVTHICIMNKVSLWSVHVRIQIEGWLQGELVMLYVYIEL